MCDCNWMSLIFLQQCRNTAGTQGQKMCQTYVICFIRYIEFMYMLVTFFRTLSAGVRHCNLSFQTAKCLKTLNAAQHVVGIFPSAYSSKKEEWCTKMSWCYL